MGFALPGFTGEDLARDFARTPLARLAKRPDDRIHLRPRVSLSLHLTSSANKRETPVTEKTTLLGFLRQYAPKRLSKATSGLWVHLTPRRTSLPTDRRSWEAAFALPESLGTAGGAKPRDPARAALQSIQFRRSTDRVTTKGRTLIGLAARSEFLARQGSTRIG